MDNIVIIPTQDNPSIKKVPMSVKGIAVLLFVFSLFSAVALYFVFMFITAIGDESHPFPSLQIGLVSLALVVLMFFVSRSLYKGKNWARIVVIIIGVGGIVLAIVNGIKGEGLLGNGLSFIINAVITGYLLFNKKVKKAFKK